MNNRNFSANFLSALILGLSAVVSQAQALTTLDENCVINILNRTVQVTKAGNWALPNVPSDMGKIRARATCTLADGRTVLGVSDYFTIADQPGADVDVGDIKFDEIQVTPSALKFSTTDTLIFTQVDETSQLQVTAFYPDGSVKNLTLSNGIK